MKLKFYKDDLLRIGIKTNENERSCLTVWSNPEVSNMEYIMLREILKTFGKEYIIIEEKKFALSTEFITNLPYVKYNKIVIQNDFSSEEI